MSKIGRVESTIQARISKGTQCAALIDPENFPPEEAAKVARAAEKCGSSIILIGGSTLSDQTRLDEVVTAVKKSVTSPVILFPGNITGVSKYADAILFSSLLNSTNPYFIIGAQALGSRAVYESRLESIPMGYLVFGNSSTTSIIGQTNGLPASKPALAVIYALAAQYLGMRTLYLEAGSGAEDTVPLGTIQSVREHYKGLLVVGGGITDADKAAKIAKAGADIIVVGNLLQQPGFEETLTRITKAVRTR
jgi:phosphoglycerol geranylgeranyltransferase